MVEFAPNLQSVTPGDTDPSSLGPVVVRIELLRVQTFLFAVPRLRHMIGANVMLGEVMRRALPALAVRCGARSAGGTEGWLSSFPQPPCNDNPDPLAKTRWEQDRDEPQRLASRGILVRDGGHFAALFPTAPQARRFQDAAGALIYRELPGLMFQISRIDLGAAGHTDGTQKDPRPARLADRRVLVDLPIFDVCRFTGRGPAATRVTMSRSEKKDPIPSSQLALRLKRRGDAFFGQDRATDGQARTRDIIGLLREQLPNREQEPPVDLSDLCGPDTEGRRDYLAVIHADGNRVGLRFSERYLKGEPPAIQGGAGSARTASRGEDYLSREGFGEAFYYSMRIAVRSAVVDALTQTFGAYEGTYRPFQLLMLGGDDLLLLCRARFALRFLVAYAQGLQNFGLADTEGDEPCPLSIGAGVVIARPSVPFHRLHALAEDLAGSAKRLDRATGTQGPGVSVVDWMVFSESWADEIAAVRRREAQVCYRLADGNEEWLALTGRPYRILRPQEGQADSLEALLTDAAHLSGAARSQLRQIALDLYQGRRWAELRWQELPADTRQAFLRAGLDKPWRPLSQRHDGDRTISGYMTRLADLVELNEFAYLGRKEEPQRQTVATSGEERHV